LESDEFDETVFASFKGHSLFSIIVSNKKWELFYHIKERIKSKLKGIQLRRLYYILKQPFLNCTEDRQIILKTYYQSINNEEKT
jgi:hypothetical protein